MSDSVPPPVEVVTVGETMRLLVAEPGIALRRATTFRSGIAGAESNVAVGLARLGHRVRWLSAVGDDASGAAVLEKLRGEGVDVTAVRVDPDRPTGLLVRDSHPQRAIAVEYHRRGSAATGLGPDDITAATLSGVRHVHVTGITPMLSGSAAAAVDRLLDLAQANGASVSLDPNVRRRLAPAERWPAVVAPLLARADIVLGGDDELELVTGRPAADAVAELLAGRSQIVVVKNADHSCTVTTADGSWTHASMVTRMVDPVGCGDAVTSGFLSAWLGGADVAQALRSGVASAASVAMAVDDIEGLPDAGELAALLASDAREMVNR